MSTYISVSTKGKEIEQIVEEYKIVASSFYNPVPKCILKRVRGVRVPSIIENSERIYASNYCVFAGKYDRGMIIERIVAFALGKKCYRFHID